MAKEKGLTKPVKVILIILAIIIIGPLVFIGGCFPVGLGLSFFSVGEWGLGLMPLAIFIGLALAIFVVYKIIKAISKR